jgi:hypothetical protein
MLKRVLSVQTHLFGAALAGSVLVYSAAHAQVGCCEGGSAIGANAWTAGNVQEWPVGSSPLTAPAWQWPAPMVGGASYKDGGAEPYWWTHGEIELGGRGFVNNPRADGATAGDTVSGVSPSQTVGYSLLNQKSLAKFYEYGIQAPGAFGGGHFAMGSHDGLYQLDFWANNVGANFAGFSDQSYMLTASKVGEHYLTATWDQTAHIYSTSAQTPFTIGRTPIPGVSGGAGAVYLTLPAEIVATPLTASAAGGYGAKGPTGAGIVPFLHTMDLGIQRDTISFAYRWTPTDDWDINTDYTHRDRYGTQAGGIANLWNGGNQANQIPVPIDDTTQNYGVNGERIGNTPWGKYTFKLAYSGSTYTENISSFFVQNPFFPSLANCLPNVGTTAGTANCVAGQMSTPPSNQANSVSGTLGADLPLNTRYTGTISFTNMTQNDPFLPMTNNPNAGLTGINSAYGNIPWNQVNFGFTNLGLTNRAYSLNGDIDTILFNNVMTTKLSPDLTAKLTYRFYDFDNQTPNIIFPCWVGLDKTGGTVPASATVDPTKCNGTTAAANLAIASLSMSYIKQNAGAELNWRPEREWNLNAAYGFERYDWSKAPVNATNESSAKLSADWKPARWFDTRLSGSVASRRYEDYDYMKYVAAVQYPFLGTLNGGMNWSNATSGYNAVNCGLPCISPNYRAFSWNNRDEAKASYLANITVIPSVTISPSVKYQEDHYGVDPNFNTGLGNSPNLGVKDSAILSAGVDAVYTPRPDLSLSLSYYWEKYNTLYYATTGTGDPNLAGQLVNGNKAANFMVATRDNEYVNTVAATMHYAFIQDKLDFDLRGALSDGLIQQSTACDSTKAFTGNNAGAACTAFPNDTNLFSHVEANLTYKLDPALLGESSINNMKLRLRYLWESNALSNWQNDALAPYSPGTNVTGAAPGTPPVPVITNTPLWMGYNNPNYNVQALAASLIVQW